MKLFWPTLRLSPIKEGVAFLKTLALFASTPYRSFCYFWRKAKLLLTVESGPAYVLSAKTDNMLRDLPINILVQIGTYLTKWDAYNVSNTCQQLKSTFNYLVTHKKCWNKGFIYEGQANWSVLESYRTLEGYKVVDQQWFASLATNAQHPWSTFASSAVIFLELRDANTNNVLYLTVGSRSKNLVPTPGCCCKVVSKNHWGLDKQSVTQSKAIVSACMVEIAAETQIPWGNYEYAITKLPIRALKLDFEDHSQQFIAMRYSHLLPPRAQPPILNNIEVSMVGRQTLEQRLQIGRTYIPDSMRLLAFPHYYFYAVRLGQNYRTYRRGVVDSFGTFHLSEDTTNHVTTVMKVPIHSETALVRACSVYDLNLDSARNSDASTARAKLLPGYFGECAYSGSALRPLTLVASSTSASMIQGVVAPDDLTNFARLVSAHRHNSTAFPFNCGPREIRQLDNLARFLHGSGVNRQGHEPGQAPFDASLVALISARGQREIRPTAARIAQFVNGKVCNYEYLDAYCLQDMIPWDRNHVPLVLEARAPMAHFHSAMRVVHTHAEFKRMTVVCMALKVKRPSIALFHQLRTDEMGVMDNVDLVMILRDSNEASTELVLRMANPSLATVDALFTR